MNVRQILVVLGLCAFVGSAPNTKGNSKPENIEDTYGSFVDGDNDMQNDDFDYGLDEEGSPPQEDNNLSPPEEHAEFISKPGVYPATIGDSIYLPCETTNQEIVTIWEKEDAGEKILLFQAGVPMKNSDNVVLNANNTLKVHVEKPTDYGAYACILMNDAESRPALTHQIVAATPPAIRGIWTNKNNETVYKQGETMMLTCEATGYPKPTISWHKENERLLVTGDTLTIPNVSKDSAGIYRCLADQPTSPSAMPVHHKPSHSFIQIHVEHPPQISVKEYLVTSNKERDAELICLVDAFPQPKIVWKKGDEIIINEGKTKISIDRRQKFIESKLLITDLADDDFTTYTCLARNSLGRMEKSISLVKVPVVREFSKPDKSNKDVVLTWKVESSSPIIAHEIQYRKKGETEWNVAKPEVTKSESDVYTVKYTLKDLDAGSYETRVRSQSEHGWSEYSSIIPFEGVLAKHGSSTHKKHHKNHHKDQKEKELKEKHISAQQEATSAPRQQEIIQKEAPVGASKTSASSAMASSLTTLSIALIFLCSIRQ
ncbi:unnamed protein product [Phyllotreta striolata]|uniref:Uncharacterized protein n=1 Tax=Phyllotreta striolata TaxID=444603 RepID=A0A9N9TH66_PHYSR|nr:unnamed protein product [Phyllotreta striolata]